MVDFVLLQLRAMGSLAEDGEAEVDAEIGADPVGADHASATVELSAVSPVMTAPGRNT